MTNTLIGTARGAGENLAQLRQNGSVPAVVYGIGRETLSISVPLREFTKVLKEVGESGTIALTLPDGVVTVLVHDVMNHHLKGTPEHVDFLAIDISKPIQVTIPIEFTGIAPAVKNGLGVLVKVIHEIEVKGLSKDVPHKIEVDLSSLVTLDDQITVADLVLPSGVTVTADGEEIVAAISTIKEESDEPAATIDFAAIEVEKKGKKEEEAGAAE